MLAVLLATMVVGIAGADSATVSATITTPSGPICALSVQQSSIDLSSGSAIINVANTGSSGWSNGQNNVPSAMSVAVSGTDWTDGFDNYAFSVGTTSWSSWTWQGPYALSGSPNVAYSGLPSGGSYSDAPITFTATAPGSAKAGTTYYQTITVSGSC